MNPEIFQTGYCLEFAKALQERNINFEIALVGKNFYDEDFEEDAFEACHAVIVNPKNKNYFIDSKGERTLNDLNPVFNEKVKGELYIRKLEGGLEEAESFLGAIEKDALVLAREYIDQNKELFDNFLPESLGEALYDYIDLNVKGSYNKLKDFLKRTVDWELEYGFLDEKQFVEKIDQTILLAYKYHNNIKNHSKRQYINEKGDIKDDEYYFSLDSTKSFEGFFDGIQKISNYNENVKYAKSFLKSYKHLVINKKTNTNNQEYDVINKDSLKLFSIIKEKDLDREEIEKSLRKIASFKDVETLNNALYKIMKENALSIGQKEKEIKKSEDMEILMITENRIYARPLNFEGSQKFGSNQWCISTDDHYYFEYLEKIESEYYADQSVFPEESLTTESPVEGSHIFCWDFEEPEESDLRQFAFTVSSGGDIVAAHDKDDQDILSDIEDLLNSEKNKVINKAIKYNEEKQKEFLDSFNDKSQILEKPDFLVTCSKHPLNMFRKIMEGKEEHLTGYANNIFISNSLINESLSRFHKFKGDIPAAEMISDIFYFENFVKNHATFTQLEEWDEDYIPDEIQNVCEYCNGDVFINKYFSKVLEELSDIDKQLIFSEHKTALKEITKDILTDLSHTQMHGLNNKYREFQTIKSDTVIHLAKFFINEDWNDFEKEHLIISYVFKGENKNENIFNECLSLISKEKIHINKVLFNSEGFNKEQNQKLAEIINNNPHIIKEICPQTFFVFSGNKELLNSLNEESCKAIKKALNNFEFKIETPSYFGNTDNVSWDLAQKLQNMVDKNIIDRQFLEEKLDRSKIAYGHLNSGKDSEGNVMDIIDYACLNQNKKQTKKLRRKL